MALHETGEPAVEARISNLTSTGLWRGQDSASGFIKGSLMLEEFAYKYDTYEELLDAVIKGVHGARVLVPDAHVSLRVRPCCDVMVAHLRVWQHFSIDHPVYGRYSTAVHIS